MRKKKYDASKDWTVSITFSQSREFTESEISVDSVDLILGLLGGYTAILWGVSEYFMSGYSDFKFFNSLIGSVY